MYLSLCGGGDSCGVGSGSSYVGGGGYIMPSHFLYSVVPYRMCQTSIELVCSVECVAVLSQPVRCLLSLIHEPHGG